MTAVAWESIVGSLRRAWTMWWHGESGHGACQSCGVAVDPPLDICLDCLADRHW